MYNNRTFTERLLAMILCPIGCHQWEPLIASFGFICQNCRFQVASIDRYIKGSINEELKGGE